VEFLFSNVKTTPLHRKTVADGALNEIMVPKDDDEFKTEEQETNPEFDLAPGRGQHQLEHGLKSRHIQFLALGMEYSSP
jgi:amino acid permease